MKGIGLCRINEVLGKVGLVLVVSLPDRGIVPIRFWVERQTTYDRRVAKQKRWKRYLAATLNRTLLEEGMMREIRECEQEEAGKTSLVQELGPVEDLPGDAEEFKKRLEEALAKPDVVAVEIFPLGRRRRFPIPPRKL